MSAASSPISDHDRCTAIRTPGPARPGTLVPGRRRFLAGSAATLLLSAGSPQVLSAAQPVGKSRPGDWLGLAVGTYTGGASQGIYRLSLNRSTGQLRQGGLMVRAEQPSFLATSPRHPNRLFAVGETQTDRGGAVVSFRNSQSDWSLESQQPTQGDHPCHLNVNPIGDLIAVANYSGGSYSCFHLDGTGLNSGSCFQHQGSGPNRQRQTSPHGHCVRFLPGQDRRLLAADLGTDQILYFQVEMVSETPQLTLINDLKMPPGAGPRQIDFHPNGRWAYVINELNNTVVQFTMPDDRGKMEIVSQVDTLPASFSGNSSTAHLQVHPTGRFLYGSNRGHDSIAIFSLDEATGTPRAIGHRLTGGRTPRHFLVEPEGRFLLAANQDTDSVVVFPVNSNSGQLEPSVFQAYVPRPVCVIPQTP